MQKSACFTSALPRLELQKTACAQETARRTATDARSARLAEDGEFAEKKLVRDNFESSFIALFPESDGAKSLQDFDFLDPNIYQYEVRKPLLKENLQNNLRKR